MQVESPLDAIRTISTIQGVRAETEARRLAAEEARQNAKDAAAVRQVMVEANGDFEKALPKLRMIAPAAALKFETAIATQQKEHFQSLKAKTEAETERTARSLRFLQGATPQTYPAIYGRLQQEDPEVAGLLPPTFDADRVRQVQQIGLSAKEALDQRNLALTLLKEGHTMEALSTYFSTVPETGGADEWQKGLDDFTNAGVPKSLLALVGPYGPGAPAHAAALGISPAKAAELAGQAETRAQTEKHQTTQEELQRGQLAVSQGQLRVAQDRERREGAAAGGAAAVKLSPTQQEDIATMLTMEQLASDVQKIGKDAGTLPGVGPMEGRVFPSLRGSGGTTGETLRDKIGNIQGTIAKLRGGTSFTPTEKQLLETYTPTTTDRDEVILTKITNLVDFIRKKRENTLRVARGEYTLPTTTGSTVATTGTNPFRK